MGIVYFCHDQVEKRLCVLKTIRPEYISSRVARERLLREGLVWIDLGPHPHIVRCYDVFTADGQVYLVLEPVIEEPGLENSSLRAHLEPGEPLSLEHSLLLALQIAWGMAHAVATVPGLVHRDLKPENLLVSGDFLWGTDVRRVRITDFGLAYVLQSARPHTSANETRAAAAGALPHRTQLTVGGGVGTPLYMAPEQWRGAEVDARTDIYALGCIAYEMLTGHHAVRGTSVEALRSAHCRGDLRPLPTSLTAEAQEFVSRCLSLDARGRYASWAAVEHALTTAYEAAVGRSAPAVELVPTLSAEEQERALVSRLDVGQEFLFDIRKPKVAVGCFEWVRVKANAAEMRQLEGVALGHLGRAYASMQDLERAIQYYRQQLEVVQKANDRRTEGRVLGDMGRAYLDLGDTKRAIPCFEQELRIARAFGDARWEGRVLGQLGWAQLARYRPALAIDRFQQQLTIAQETDDLEAEGSAAEGLGRAYGDLHDWQQAIPFIERELSIARNREDRHWEGRAMRRRGQAYVKVGKSGEVLAEYQEELDRARGIRDREGRANALGALGMVCAENGQTDLAIDYHEKHRDVCREVGDDEARVETLFRLSSLYLEQGRKEASRKAVEDATRIASEKGYTANVRRPPQP